MVLALQTRDPERLRSCFADDIVAAECLRAQPAPDPGFTLCVRRFLEVSNRVLLAELVPINLTSDRNPRYGSTTLVVLRQREPGGTLDRYDVYSARDVEVARARFRELSASQSLENASTINIQWSATDVGNRPVNAQSHRLPTTE